MKFRVCCAYVMHTLMICSGILDIEETLQQRLCWVISIGLSKIPENMDSAEDKHVLEVFIPLISWTN
jgi:hypothetical protein